MSQDFLRLKAIRNITQRILYNTSETTLHVTKNTVPKVVDCNDTSRNKCYGKVGGVLSNSTHSFRKRLGVKKPFPNPVLLPKVFQAFHHLATSNFTFSLYQGELTVPTHI